MAILASFAGNFVWYSAVDDMIELSCMEHIELVHAEALRSQADNQPARAARLFGYLLDYGTNPREFCRALRSEQDWTYPLLVTVETHQRTRRYREIGAEKLEKIYAWEEAFIRRSYYRELAKMSLDEELANQRSRLSLLLFEGDEAKAQTFMQNADDNASNTPRDERE